MTSARQKSYYLRRCVLRMWWDGEPHPSVEVPLGDFFGLGHAETRNFACLPLAMTPQAGRGMTCYFPLTFSSRAVLSLTSECAREPVACTMPSTTRATRGWQMSQGASTRSGVGKTPATGSRRPA